MNDSGADLQHKAIATAPDGFGFEAGRLVPVVSPDVATDEPPDTPQSETELPPLGVDAVQILDLIISGAQDGAERDRRLLILAMRYKHPAAPKTKTQLALWLGVSRQTVHADFTRVLAYLQAEIIRLQTPH